MKELAVSKFKINGPAAEKQVRKTGKPVAGLVPTKPAPSQSWLGSMRGMGEDVGDLIAPSGAFDAWSIHNK
jgi:hypothetical protein